MHARWKSKVGEGLSRDDELGIVKRLQQIAENCCGKHLPQLKECNALIRRQRRMGFMPRAEVGEGGLGEACVMIRRGGVMPGGHLPAAENEEEAMQAPDGKRTSKEGMVRGLQGGQRVFGQRLLKKRRKEKGRGGEQQTISIKLKLPIFVVFLLVIKSIKCNTYDT